MEKFTKENKLLDLLLDLQGELLYIVTRHESVTMRKKNAFTVQHYGFRFSMDSHSSLLFEPTKCPNIMITNKEMHLNAFIRNIFYSLQERTILLFAFIYPKELTPEVKDIPKHVDGSRILLHSAKHGD